MHRLALAVRVHAFVFESVRDRMSRHLCVSQLQGAAGDQLMYETILGCSRLEYGLKLSWISLSVARRAWIQVCALCHGARTL